jgi:hypothetical protein
LPVDGERAPAAFSVSAADFVCARRRVHAVRFLQPRRNQSVRESVLKTLDQALADALSTRSHAPNEGSMSSCPGRSSSVMRPSLMRRSTGSPRSTLAMTLSRSVGNSRRASHRDCLPRLRLFPAHEVPCEESPARRSRRSLSCLESVQDRPPEPVPCDTSHRSLHPQSAKRGCPRVRDP